MDIRAGSGAGQFGFGFNAMACFLALIFLLSPMVARAQSEFKYKLPDGFEDLKASNPRGDYIPAVMRDAASSQFAFYAADPKSTNLKMGSTFNAVEVRTAGRITKETAEQSAAQLGKQVVAAGFGFRLIEARLVKIGGVDSALTIADIESPEGTRRLMQYLVSGEKMSTILSYSAPREDISHYQPLFEASAMGTRGAYSHGGYSVGRGLIAGGIGGGVASLAYVFIALARKRRDGRQADEESPRPSFSPKPRSAMPAAATSGAAPRGATKHTWVCPSCNNPVPIRLDTCRCGAQKPA